MATKKMKLEELKVKSFTTGEQVGGGPYPASAPFCTYGDCSAVTYCQIIGTNNMYQCIEDGCL